jgi:cell division initiation protein
MGLTPMDIHNKEFPRKFRGYDSDAVDEFLDQVVREFELLIKEHGNQREQVERLTLKLQEYRNLEDTINKTLLAAQEAAEELRTNVRKEADLTIQEARLQAEKIIDTGHSKARRIIEENADLKRAAHTLRTQVRALLIAQLQSIDALPDPFAQAAFSQLENEKAALEAVKGTGKDG